MAYDIASFNKKFEDDIALEVVVSHAVRVGWQSKHPDQNLGSYGQNRAEACSQFIKHLQLNAADSSLKRCVSGPNKMGWRKKLFSWIACLI